MEIKKISTEIQQKFRRNSNWKFQMEFQQNLRRIFAEISASNSSETRAGDSMKTPGIFEQNREIYLLINYKILIFKLKKVPCKFQLKTVWNFRGLFSVFSLQF